MAKRRRKRGSTSRRRRSSPRRRRSRTVTTTTRTVRLSNPKLGGMFVSGLTGIVAGAATGLVTTKFLGDKSAGLRALGTVGLAVLGTLVLRKRPVLADSFGAGALSSLGYGFAVNAAGGVVATNKADALALTAKIPDAKTGTAEGGQKGMGVLLPFGGRVAAANGMGVLYNNQAARSLTGMGANSQVRRPVNPRALLG